MFLPGWIKERNNQKGLTTSEQVALHGDEVKLEGERVFLNRAACVIP